MKLLQVTILCLLSSLCSSENNEGTERATTPVLTSSTISATETSVIAAITATMTSPNLVETSRVVTSSKGITSGKSLQTVLLSTISSLATTTQGEGATTSNVTKGALNNPIATVTNLLLSNAVSTLQSSQPRTQNQSSINSTERLVSTPQPDASSSKTSILPPISTTVPKNISPSQGTENAKNASSSSSISPSHSNIILPVVIALIVITLSVFALVGLYRICRKTDPGSPENGNDQPQSDKESVKLLTVKTISHESGEHSAQGKTKN